MLTEQQKDRVYFSSDFASYYKSMYQGITAILDENHVKHGLLKGTADYWCRDYMPVQAGPGQFVQFEYHPDYLEGKRKRETPAEVVSANAEEVVGSGCLKKLNIVADGGNFTVCTTKRGEDVIVMTDKIFVENYPATSRERIIEEIEGAFNRRILFLPWDKNDKWDKCGHTDGIVHNIGDGRILVNLAVYPKKIAAEMRQCLETEFEVVDLKLSYPYVNSWAYINMLQTRDVIIVPALGLSTDSEALEQIKALHPDYEGRIYMVRAENIIKRYGGALNCLSWTIRS